MHYRKRKAQYHFSAFSSAISIYLLGNTFRSVGLSTGVGKGVVMMSLPVMNVTPPRTAPFPPDSTTRQHHRSSRSTSGRYASYWNAFLFCGYDMFTFSMNFIFLCICLKYTVLLFMSFSLLFYQFLLNFFAVNCHLSRNRCFFGLLFWNFQEKSI